MLPWLVMAFHDLLWLVTTCHSFGIALFAPRFARAYCGAGSTPLTCHVMPCHVYQVLSELKEYATEVDVDFVRKAVRAIGRCAIKVG